jgi:hypothetical protein
MGGATVTPPESPSSLLERAAQRLDSEGGVITRPVADWLRDIADILRGRDTVQGYHEEHALIVAGAILGEPVPGEDE